MSDSTEKDPDDLGFRRRADDGRPGFLSQDLSEQLHQPDAYAENLTKAEASKRIDALKAVQRELVGAVAGAQY